MVHKIYFFLCTIYFCIYLLSNDRSSIVCKANVSTRQQHAPVNPWGRSRQCPLFRGESTQGLISVEKIMRPAKISVGCFSRFLRGKTSPRSFVPICDDVYLLPCSRQLARNKRSHPAETSRSKQKLDSVLIWMTYTVQFLGALIGRIVDNPNERNVSEKIQKRERYICAFEKEKKPGEWDDEGEKGSGTLARETIGHLDNMGNFYMHVFHVICM